jgi:hypothetical protein
MRKQASSLKKKKFLRRYKVVPTQANHDKFKQIRNKVRYLTREVTSKHDESLASVLKTNPKKNLEVYLHSKARKASSNPTLS